MKDNFNTFPNPKDFESREAYLQAIHAWRSRVTSDLKSSITFYETQWRPRKDTEVAKRDALISAYKEVLGE